MIDTHNFFIGRTSRRSVAEGRATYVPAFLSDLPLLLRSHRLPLDWALLNLSPPDQHGFCSLGTEVCVALPAAESARRIIAQLNPNVPRTHGNSLVHIDCIDYALNVPHDHPLAPLPSPPANINHSDADYSDTDTRIGKLLASMIPDGATLQVGIGSIPNAVLHQLRHHKHLGVHSEMISDGIMDLMKAGAIDNTQKDFLKYHTVTSFLVGSPDLYAFVHDNPSIWLADASFTNDPSLIRRNRSVVAINSALQIDLTGQVCADSIGPRMVSGVGGQVDFISGSAHSQNGMPIICVRSKNRGQSTIVGVLREGSGVTTTRYHAHWVVTEYGAVDLWGRTVVERAKALIHIAHPEAREQLAKEAYERFKVVVT